MLDPGGAPSGPQSGLGPTLGSGDLATPAASIGAEEPCRFPKLEECAHFHYERVQLPKIELGLKGDLEISVHSHSGNAGIHYYTIQVTCRDECWLIQRTFDNFIMLDAQLHQCIYDRKVSRLPDLQEIKERKDRHRRRRCKSEGHDVTQDDDFRDENDGLESTISQYLSLLSSLIDNSLNCGPILNWFQLDNRGHRLLVPHEDLRSINTPAVAAAYSVRRYVSQARDELNLEVGDMISVIDMASPGESVWWRGKRGFQVGFFPQYCVHIIGDKVPRNVILPAPVVGSLAISPIKPVLRKHGKLITFFRSFILNRPSRRRLKQSGILKERVFGCDLGEHLLNSGHDIPMVLKCCAEFIESHGIVDGIYRLSGVTSNIQKLRNAFDEDRIPNLYTDDILQDIHSVASLLKMYFRELPNPLCTYQLYQSFVQAVQGCSASRNKQNDNERLLKMREAVQKLPPPHYRTLEYLMRHLQLISTHGHNTGMTTRNLAIVWAPNLLRCEELEIGGVAALQGVGVQAVVTEFLVCYADLIFSEKVSIESSLAPPTETDSHESKDEKRLRPKSLAISTPTKLITLEEARNKQLLNKDDGSYIDVGGGPNSLPKKYHTVIELPPGSRKRGLSKRSSPSGWRSFFSKSRNSSHGNLSKNRDISSPGIIPMDKSVTESDLNDIKRKLRPVKSAESLTSGQSEPANCETDVLGPLHCLSKASGHNRSVSHDSYFDNLQSSQNNSVGSLLDLSEIQLNFELEESEMRIFSEDESLVSSPKVSKETGRKLNRSRLDDFSSVANSANPSPKKQPRVVISPESLSRKRSRLEDQLSDIQFIDCTTPESNICLISTTALVHNETKDSLPNLHSVVFEGYQPKNKSPRNENRHSLNFEKIDKITIPKSFTDIDFKNMNLSPSPGSPIYKPLHTSSTNSPNLSLDLDSPKNLTTISITYKSPKKNESIYETIELNPEKAVVPTTESSLPIQEASMPKFPMETKLLETSFDNSFISITSTLKDENSLDSDKNIPKRPTNLNFSENIATDLDSSENSKKSLITETENVPNSSNNSSDNSSEITPTQNQTNSLDFDDVSESKTMESILSDISSKKDKRKSCDSEFLDENSIYQQVKYFRRSIHEINSLLDLEKLPKSKSTDNITDLHPNLGKTDFNSLKIDFDLSHPSHPILGVGTYQTLEEHPKTGVSQNSAEIVLDSNTHPKMGATFKINFDLSHPILGVGTDQTLEEHPKMGVSKNLTEIVLDSNTHPKMGATHYENILPDLEHNLEQTPTPKMGINIENSPENIYLVYENLEQTSNPNLDLKMGVAHYEDLAQSLEHNLEQISDPNMGVETFKIIDQTPKSSDYENISNEIFDSLESDNVNIYENVESLEDSRTNLEHSKTKFHEINPKIVKISNEEILDLPVCQKCTSDDKISVKNLTSKFETKKIYDKDSLPPCLRAKNNKNNTKTRSLDENAFSVEFGHVHRRKSLDERVSSFINSKILADNKNSSTSDISVDIKKDLNLGDQKLNRERIEKYKEERRIFLREKYRSESFKEDKDLLLQRFKHKNIKKEENIESSRDLSILNTEKDLDFAKKRLENIKNDPINTKKHSIPNEKTNLDTKKPVLEPKFSRLDLKSDKIPILDPKKPVLDQNSLLLDRLLDEKSSKSSFLEQKYPILDTKKQVLDPKKPLLDHDSPLLDRLSDKIPVLDPKKPVLDQNSPLLDRLLDEKSSKSSFLEQKYPILDAKKQVLDTKKPLLDHDSPLLDRLSDEKSCKPSLLDQKFGKKSFLDQDPPFSDRKNTKTSHLEHKTGRLDPNQTVLEPKESVLQSKKAIFEQKSPVFERKTRLKELSEILDESVEDSSILLRCSREDLRHRRTDEDKIERRRHTYDLLRERETDIDRRQSLESRPRDKKCSPAYTIRDMKAIFESKSQQ